MTISIFHALREDGVGVEVRVGEGWRRMGRREGEDGWGRGRGRESMEVEEGGGRGRRVNQHGGMCVCVCVCVCVCGHLRKSCAHESMYTHV